MDLEMTGIDPDKQGILEIATAVTDENLKVVAEGPNIAIHQPEGILSAMEQWSMTHHAASGLLDRVRTSPCDCKGAEEMTLKFLSLHTKKGCSPLCGNSVWQDRRFLEKYMPRVNAFLHYRNIDVSSIKELVKRWYPHLPIFKKQKTHLALRDIKESIAELRYYRQKVFLPKERV
jgi:oligoribonuclease